MGEFMSILTINRHNSYLNCYAGTQNHKKSYKINTLNQVAFEGNNDKKKQTLSSSYKKAIYGLAFISSLFSTPTSSLDVIKPENYKPDISQKNGWTENVQVLASTSQRYSSYGTDLKKIDNYKIKVNGVYSFALLEQLKNGKANNFYEAHKFLEKNKLKKGQKLLTDGKYIFYTQTPVSTSNNINSWNINDKTKTRIVLAVGGSEKRHTKGIKGFCEEIRGLYSIPQENIIQVTDADKNSFKQGLDKLAEKLQKADLKNTEVLIYYSGHGNTISIESGIFDDFYSKEGDAVGTTETGMNEPDLKEYVKKKLKEVKILFIFDTCHAGAFITNTNTANKSSFDQVI
jgi:hypothetical protein